MKAYISNQGSLRNFQTFLRSLDLSDDSVLDIYTHEKWTTAHPANLVIVAALALKVGCQSARIVNRVPQSGLYLDRMGLYNFVSTPSPFNYGEREPSGRFIPLTIIKTPEDQSKFIADTVPLLHISESHSSIIKYILGELIRNSLEHSGSIDGAVVAAQYYRDTNRVSIAICDTGIGIWKSMNNVWHPKTDLEAIKLALTPGITGTTRREGGSSDNAGAGLFYVKSMAQITRNHFVIYSGKAEYTLLMSRPDLKKIVLHPNPMDDRCSYMDNAPDFGGTLVSLDLTMDETPEFTALIDMIGSVYDDAIRDRKRNAYREPRFI